MPPFMGGGEMIEKVGLDESTYAPPPGRFEPGTPAIAEAIGLGAAVDYLSNIGMDRVHAFEEEIGGLLYQEVSSAPLHSIFLCSKTYSLAVVNQADTCLEMGKSVP